MLVGEMSADVEELVHSTTNWCETVRRLSGALRGASAAPARSDAQSRGKDRAT